MTGRHPEVIRSIRAAISRVRRLTSPGIRVSPFKRHLTSDEALALAERVSDIFGVLVLPDEVQRVAAELRRIEGLMIGRIAGDVEDYVAYCCMVRESARVPTCAPRAHAEIGVLFGGGLLLALQALVSVGSSDWVIGIDPFEGYYGRRRDPTSNRRVRKSTVVKNAAKVGLAADRLRLVPRRSEDPAAIEEVSRYSLASLWIDGDHSFEGVARDWRNYAPMVSPGGFVLFDNYHDQSWPEVGRFVDDALLPHLQGWDIAGSLGRSLLLRRAP